MSALGDSETALGPDRVLRLGERLIVRSRVDMPDWNVRRFRRLAILFEGRRYFVCERTVEGGADGTVRYVLAPWPDTLHDLPAGEAVYDEAFVQARDAARRELRARRSVGLVLFVLIPLLGFVWSRTKRRLLRRYGISTRTATTWSVRLEWLVLLFGSGPAALLGAFGGPVGRLLLVAWFAFWGVDLMFRYGDLHRDEPVHYGFYEWLFAFRVLLSDEREPPSE